MKRGVLSYVNSKYCFAALEAHVDVGLSLRGVSKGVTDLLQGSRITTKHIEFSSLKGIDEKRVATLLKLMIR